MAARKHRVYIRRILRAQSNDATQNSVSRGAEDAAGASRVPPTASVADVLAQGEITACKELPWGSNYSFAVLVSIPNEDAILSVYKPRRGEVPLWDFPDGTLYLREYASYLLSQFLGWDFIPTTVIREGPYGVGTVQLYVDPDEEVDYDRLHAEHRADLQRIAVFDLIANNADRKHSHILRDRNGKVWGIDHGLTFNAVPKLRTVLWEFCGEPFPPDVRAHLASIVRDSQRMAALHALLSPYLAEEEVTVTIQRLRRVAEMGTYPMLNPHRNYPRGFW